MVFLTFLSLVALCSLATAELAVTTKLYSYFCLVKSLNQDLCLGISSSGEDPVYRGSDLYHLQLKPRRNNELKGLDHQKLRWSVDRERGRIRMTNFTDLCLARFSKKSQVVLRVCEEGSAHQAWELLSFMSNANEEGRIQSKADPSQCLTVMACDRRNQEYCDERSMKPSLSTHFTVDIHRGSFLKMTPCVEGRASQAFRQTLDCAPGCSPFMIQPSLEGNACDPECANEACGFDGGACTDTPSPTTPLDTHQNSTFKRPTPSPSASVYPELVVTQSPNIWTESPTLELEKSDQEPPQPDAHSWLWAVIVLLLLLCILLAILRRNRRKQIRSEGLDAENNANLAQV